MVKQNRNAPVTFELLTQFYVEFLKPQFDELKKIVTQTSKDVQVVKTDIRYIKDDINGLKGELATTVSRKEFNELKLRSKILLRLR